MSATVQPDGVLARVIRLLERRVDQVERGHLRVLRAPVRFQGTDESECVVNVVGGKILGCFELGSVATPSPSPTRDVAPIPPWNFTDGSGGTTLDVSASDAWPAPWSCAVAGVLITSGAGTGVSTITLTGSEGVETVSVPAAGGTTLVEFVSELTIPLRSTLVIACTVANGHTGVVVQPYGYLTSAVA